MFAAEPNSERFPATVLTHARMSQAFFSLLGDIAAAQAATFAPSKRTCEPMRWAAADQEFFK
ncbi:hypothetical protein Peur_064520 [Populus x canadensis]